MSLEISSTAVQPAKYHKYTISRKHFLFAMATAAQTDDVQDCDFKFGLHSVTEHAPHRPLSRLKDTNKLTDNDVIFYAQPIINFFEGNRRFKFFDKSGAEDMLHLWNVLVRELCLREREEGTLEVKRAVAGTTGRRLFAKEERVAEAALPWRSPALVARMRSVARGEARGDAQRGTIETGDNHHVLLANDSTSTRDKTSIKTVAQTVSRSNDIQACSHSMSRPAAEYKVYDQTPTSLPKSAADTELLRPIESSPMSEHDGKEWTTVKESNIDDEWHVIAPSSMLEPGEARVQALT